MINDPTAALAAFEATSWTSALTRAASPLKDDPTCRAGCFNAKLHGHYSRLRLKNPRGHKSVAMQAFTAIDKD